MKDSEIRSTSSENPQDDAREREWLESYRRFQNEKQAKQVWRFLTLAIAAICLTNAKKSIVWLPDPNDNKVATVHWSDWWGLKKRTFYVSWGKPTGDNDPDDEAWCIKYPDGTWRPFVVDDLFSTFYTWQDLPSSPKK
jgi:hypothetical protein